jgi:hypothetical protein
MLQVRTSRRDPGVNALSSSIGSPLQRQEKILTARNFTRAFLHYTRQLPCQRRFASPVPPLSGTYRPMLRPKCLFLPSSDGRTDTRTARRSICSPDFQAPSYKQCSTSDTWDVRFCASQKSTTAGGKPAPGKAVEGTIRRAARLRRKSTADSWTWQMNGAKAVPPEKMQSPRGRPGNDDRDECERRIPRFVRRQAPPSAEGHAAGKKPHDLAVL